MEHPSARRSIDTQEKLPELYEKDRGAAQIHGQIFEYKFCSLVFLRAKNKGYKFKLASNMTGVGAFDDVVLEYLDKNSRKSHIFLQLKSKTKQRITMQQLLNDKGDFSLRKYYDSYIKVEKNFNCSEEEGKMDGSIDQSLFIIYTNAEVPHDLKSNKVTHIGEAEFLMTGGSVLQFNEDEHKAIYQHLQDLPKHHEFLCRFRIFYSQADEKQMDCHIKGELETSMKLPESELELTYTVFLPIIQNWWQNCNYFLQDTNCTENDPLKKTSEKVRTTLVAKILDQRKSELDDLSIKYKKSAIKAMKQQIEPNKAVLIFAPGRSTTLTATKIHQILSATKHSILNLQQFMRYKTEVMLAWQSRFHVLVLENQTLTEKFQDVVDEILVMLNDCGVKKKFIFISPREYNIQQISALRATFGTKLTEEYDDLKLTDIITESTNSLLEKKVNFQGRETQLKHLVKGSDFRMLNTLDCDSISLLLANENPPIGTPTEDTLEYYIDRTLERVTNFEISNGTEIETRVNFRKERLEELQSTSSYRQEKWDGSDNGQGISQFPLANENEKGRRKEGSETNTLERLYTRFQRLLLRQNNFSKAQKIFQINSPKVWRPSTLFDSEDRITLITDGPGMGKSTLLTHLANQTREHHPDMWILRININNYTRILHGIKTNGFEEKDAIKLLTEAAQIRETEGSQLERQMFNYMCNSTGNMAVMVDGVDEVSPHYTEEVLQILRMLRKTKIRKIWVTTRNTVKDLLEEEFHCQSYSLLPFSVQDQELFLVKFWNQKYSNTKQDYIESLAKRVTDLSLKHLTEKENHFLGIPVQSLLLAEVFEENLKHDSTSNTTKLPETLNLFMLYKLYVKKKWDIYITEKKNSDRTNVNVLTDDHALYDTFIDNHKAAALIAILSTEQLEKLSDKNVLSKSANFLQKIEQGLEKTGIITDVIEGRPVFIHRTFAEYFVAGRLCDNLKASQIFMRDHLFESGFIVVRSMMDRILADKCPLHEAVLNSDMRHVAKLLENKGSIIQRDSGGRTPLHAAVSCRSPELISLLLEHGADVRSVDNMLGLSPVEYATRMADWQVLSLLMEKRPDIREQVLNEMNHGSTEYNVSALRAAARYGHTDLLRYLISKWNCVNMVLLGDSGTLIHEAARGNHVQTVRTLVDLGASCDIQNANGKTALHVAAETGSLKVVKFIVERQEMSDGEGGLKHTVTVDRKNTKLNRLNEQDKDGNTPLHLAAAGGNTSTARYLLSSGSDLRSCNTLGEYPLTLAAGYGRNDTVKFLVQGCSEMKCEEIMTSALTAAIMAGQVDTTAVLLRSGTPVNEGEHELPIHTASRLRHKEIVRLLLQNGASLKSRNVGGNTVFHLESEAAQVSWLKFLVELDREGLNVPNYENETPLHVAARNGNVNLLKYFVEIGCNINSATINGATYLHVACENGHYTAVECALKHGAEVNAMNSANETPLHIAASRGETKIVEILFLHKANFSLRDKAGITAILAASINGHQDTVQFIEEHGGNIKDTDGKGNSIAHFAVANENYEILNFLLQKNVSLDVQNSEGRTALWVAAKRGQVSIIRFLLENGSHANTPDCEGVTPVTIAARECYWEAVNEFLNHDPTIRPEDAEHLKNQLHKLSESGNAEHVRIVLKCGINVDTTNEIDATPLHVAANTGHEEVCRMLLQKGASVNAADKDGETPLILAAANGHVEVVRTFLNHGDSVDIANNEGSTPLIVAAQNDHLEIIRDLLHRGASVDAANNNGWTSLKTAATFGHIKVVRELLHHKASVNIADNDGSTPLNAAAEKGHLEIIQMLLKLDDSVDTASNNGWTPLKTAATFGHMYVVRELLKHGASVNIADNDGFTPLNAAAQKGCVEVVKVLLNHGADVDKANTKGWTPLYTAAKESQVEIVRELLNRRARVGFVDTEGYKALHIAASQGHVEIVRELLKHGSRVRGPKGSFQKFLNRGTEVSFKDKVFSPLYIASSHGHMEIVRELLNRSAKIDKANKYGLKPIDAAAFYGHVEVVRELLNRGARMERENKDGWTPIGAAVYYGHVEVVRELLNRGARLDDANKYGLKPIDATAFYGHVEVVCELLNRGARIDIASKYGWKPIDAAVKNGHVEVVRELLNRGARMDMADKYGCTPVYAAAKHGHVEVVRELLNRGARMDIADEYGWTPIDAAAFYGHVEVVRELLSRGARIDIVNEYGWTPIDAAAICGHVEIVRELLNRGAKMNIANKFGWTPIDVEAETGRLEDILQIVNCFARMKIVDKHVHGITNFGHRKVCRELLNNGHGMDNANKDGCTPINAAVKKGNVEEVRELLNHGARMDIANKYGFTPIDTAAFYGHVEVVRELLNRGAKMDIASNDGWAPIDAAAICGHVEVVRELLNRDPKMDIASKHGWTPIHAAAICGHVEVVRELLNRGAKRDIACKYGWTPIHAAASCGHVEVVRELLNHAARIDIGEKHDWAPIDAAAFYGHVEVVRDLLNSGAKMYTDNVFGRTPIRIAVQNGHPEVLQELLNHGARIDIGQKFGSALIDEAAIYGHVEVVRVLLNHVVRKDFANK